MTTIADPAIDTGDTLTGKFLISMARDTSGPFDHAVVLLCEHSDEGAMGLIVNHQFPQPTVGGLLKEFEIECSLPFVDTGVYFGGPVDRGRGFILHGPDYTCEGTRDVIEDVRITIAQTILEDLGRGRGPSEFMVVMGYAGWGEGQLESELRENMWICADGDAGLVFGEGSVEERWELALNRLGIAAAMLDTTGGHA